MHSMHTLSTDIQETDRSQHNVSHSIEGWVWTTIESADRSLFNANSRIHLQSNKPWTPCSVGSINDTSRMCLCD